MSSGPHILVIDDEPQILRALKNHSLCQEVPGFYRQPGGGRAGFGCSESSRLDYIGSRLAGYGWHHGMFSS